MIELEPSRLGRAKLEFTRTLLGSVAAERRNIRVLLGIDKTIRGDFAIVNALLFGFVTPFIALPMAIGCAGRSLCKSRG